MGTVSNIKIEPMSAKWGNDTAQVATIVCAADADDSLDGDYFFIYSALNATKYHVWFNTSGGSATNPDPGGSTAVEVALTTDDTASSVASAVATALDALSGFSASASGGTVTVTNASAGYASAPHEGSGTGFTFAVTTQGDAAADIGYVDGDIEIGAAEDLVDVTAHQTGTNVLGQIRTGKQISVTLTFKETSPSQLRKIFLAGGGSFTPAGSGGTEVYGWGQYKDFTSTLNQASTLVLHPIANASSDLSDDITFWKVYPMLETIPKSGENIQTVPVTFKCYPDTSKNSRVQYFGVGDGTQTLT